MAARLQVARAPAFAAADVQRFRAGCRHDLIEERRAVIRVGIVTGVRAQRTQFSASASQCASLEGSPTTGKGTRSRRAPVLASAE